MVSPTTGESGSQLMLSMVGACSATTATVVDCVSSPWVLVTVSEMVWSPADSNEVAKPASEEPVAGSPPPLQA